MKQATDVDIRNVGSGNVGGRNALEVTGKKWVGAVVTIIDILKGIASVVIAVMFFEDQAQAVSGAMFGSVLGHCYPVWLKFKGGRGLATGAGTLLATSWIWPFVWLALYFGTEKITKNVHASSVIALVALPVVIWLIPEHLLINVMPAYFTPKEFLSAGSLVIAVCLSRHIEPLRDYYNEKKS